MPRNKGRQHKTDHSGYALGVDIGGTFTDFALIERRTGRLTVGKVLTDYVDVSRGVMTGLKKILEENNVEPADVRVFVHGTTLATNALIERRGAKTALIVTRGFRDILTMGRESRYDIYDIEIDLPAPLVPRAMVFEITERIEADGQVETSLAKRDVRELARQIVSSGIDAVAVCLLHAFRNSVHEQAIAEIFAREAPQVSVSLSSDVSPGIGEFERASTTVANAYVRPVMRRYLNDLKTKLELIGVTASDPLIMTSDGGTIPRATAVEYPVRLIESGPAGGAMAASYIGGVSNYGDLIAFDMGGTTAKICVIENGEPSRTGQFEVGHVYRFARGSGLPIRAPVLEMIEIGAGGGSIAEVSALGLLKVGPESASANPGPACYGLGGSAATVTDADLFLGYLNADFFLGGGMALDRNLAVKAISEHVAKPLGVPSYRAAVGIHEVVNDNMARAAKVHCLQRGQDPRDYTMVAFGGAGPVHAHRVAAALGMKRVVFPARAGVMSAFGFLVSPPAFELIRTAGEPLDNVDMKATQSVFKEMEAAGRRMLEGAGIANKSISVRREAAIRYAGQTFDLLVPVPAGKLGKAQLQEMERAFLGRYRARYHRTNPGHPIEVVNWRSVVSGPKPDIKLQKFPAGAGARAALKGHRKVYDIDNGRFIDCPVYDRYALAAGAKIKGPAIVEEVESTVVIGVGARVEADKYNNLIMTLPVGRK
ncbi:MAG: hydantoinase/oxoprolinase family protein [Proteobacteria bacterium]|nr:hydantoinase/oxoprolinase family protein [Pseudomonadota bacterium]